MSTKISPRTQEQLNALSKTILCPAPGETQELLSDSLMKLRTLIEDDPALRLPSKNFDFLLMGILRVKKFSVDKAFSVYKKFCELRHNVKDIEDCCLNPRQFKELAESNFVCKIKGQDSKGRAVLLLQPRRWDPYTWGMQHAMAVGFLLVSEIMETIDAQINGIVVVADFKKLGFGHARRITPSRMQTMAKFIQDSYPASFKEIHVINHPALLNMLYEVAKPFVTEKMRKRIFFHGYDVKSLRKCVSPGLLPKHLGGDLPDNAYFDDTLVKNIYDKEELIRVGALEVRLEENFM